jgi:hypothetical protein
MLGIEGGIMKKIVPGVIIGGVLGFGISYLLRCTGGT